jgi:hypothetical protein
MIVGITVLDFWHNQHLIRQIMGEAHVWIAIVTNNVEPLLVASS